MSFSCLLNISLWRVKVTFKGVVFYMDPVSRRVPNTFSRFVPLTCAKMNSTEMPGDNTGEGGVGDGGETTGVRSFLVRAPLTALPDDIIRPSGWLGRQIAAHASLTNTAPSLVSI